MENKYKNIQFLYSVAATENSNRYSLTCFHSIALRLDKGAKGLTQTHTVETLNQQIQTMTNYDFDLVISQKFVEKN